MLVKRRMHIFFKIFIKNKFFSKKACQNYISCGITVPRDAYTLSQKGV